MPNFANPAGNILQRYRQRIMLDSCGGTQWCARSNHCVPWTVRDKGLQHRDKWRQWQP